MEKNLTWLAVAAAAILDAEGRVLMHRRPAHKQHGGLWEFPGGKVESFEKPREALIREIAEELAIRLDTAAIEPAAFAESDGSDGTCPIVLLLYTARGWTGHPVAMEGGSCAWFSLAEAGVLEMPPLDRKLYRLLVKLDPA